MQPVTFNIENVIEWEEWRNDVYPRLAYAASLKIPHLPELQEHEGRCALVGAGPSVEAHVAAIKEIGNGELNIVMSVNGAHDWLLRHGLAPDIHVVFEHDHDDIRTALGGEPHPGVTYYLASICSQCNFQQLEGYPRVLWHAYLPPQEYGSRIAKLFPHEYMVCGGYATLFRSLAIAVLLGYREFDLFGCDSSFENSSHVEGYAQADIEPRVTIHGSTPEGETRKFTTQGGLAYQVKELLEFCSNKPGLSLRVHGDGLLRYVHESRYPQSYQERNSKCL
jgi:hypothetical protein